MEERVIKETRFPNLKLFKKGKVRDTWELSGNKLLMIATDRISAFDVVMPNPIPGKGKILTKMSEFWLNFSKDIIPNHLISSDLTWTCNHEVWTHREQNDLDGRSMIIKRAQAVIPIECVVRGYLAGSSWQEYKETGQVCGITLPPGLREGDKLPEVIFTPATKAETGHDENIPYVQMRWILEDWLRDKEIKTNLFIKKGEAMAFYLRWLSLEIYKKAAVYAVSRGIIIADTKLEFGWLDGKPILIDEVLTPDSSRFWPTDEYQPSQSQKSFDKQFLRDWLIKEAKWDKKSPPPELPAEVIQKTKEKYQEALARLVS